MHEEGVGSAPRRGGGFGAWLPWLAACAIGVAVPVFVRAVRALGRNIPQPAIEVDYMAGVLWAAVLAVLILMTPTPRDDRRALLVLWGAKCFVTLGFMLVYEYSYGLDSYMYFQESLSRTPPQAAGTLGGGTEVMTTLAWYHNQILPDSYHALKVSCSMIGLAAVYLGYRAAVLYDPRIDTRLLYFLGLFPSILFWSSVLGKDPIVLFGICLAGYGVLGWTQRRRLVYFVPLLLGVWIAATIRLWLGPILLLPMVVIALREVKGTLGKVSIIGGVALVTTSVVGVFREKLAIMALEDLYARTETLTTALASGGSGDAAVQFTGLGSMITFLPVGAFRALFRPLPGEVMNPFGLLAGFENLFLLALVALAVKRLRWATLAEPVVQWALAFIVCWAGVYAFVSSNLGAAVRFKLQVLPALLCLLLYLARRRDETPMPE